MPVDMPADIHPVAAPGKKLANLRMSDRLAARIRQKVLLGNIRYVCRFFILGQEMVVRLIFAGADVFRNRKPPVLSVGEFRINIENNPPEGIEAMANDLANLELCVLNGHNRLRYFPHRACAD